MYTTRHPCLGRCFGGGGGVRVYLCTEEDETDFHYIVLVSGLPIYLVTFAWFNMNNPKYKNKAPRSFKLLLGVCSWRRIHTSPNAVDRRVCQTDSPAFSRRRFSSHPQNFPGSSYHKLRQHANPLAPLALQQPPLVLSRPHLTSNSFAVRVLRLLPPLLRVLSSYLIAAVAPRLHVLKRHRCRLGSWR